MQTETRTFNILPVVLLGAFLLALFAVFTPGWGLGNQVSVANTSHSVAKHGQDAREINRCLDRNGPSEVWKVTSDNYPNHYIQCGKLDDGRWGIRIIQWTKDKIFKEKSSFVVKDGTRSQLTEYLTARAEEFAGHLGDLMMGK